MPLLFAIQHFLKELWLVCTESMHAKGEDPLREEVGNIDVIFRS
jgi:hypothetical protein